MINQHIRNFAQNVGPNTFFGGIAKQGGIGVNAPIDTPFTLANKLGIAVNRISGFRVIGDNVECRIRGTYSLAKWGGNYAEANQNLTQYLDNDNLVTGVSSGGSLSNCRGLYKIKLNSIVTASSVFRQCTHPDLEVEMLNLKSTTNAFFSQLNVNFNQDRLVGFPSLENLGGLAFHNVYGFTELDLPTVTSISASSFYGVYNCVNYYLNNVTQAAIAPWTHGSSVCKLIELKKCKVVGSRFIEPSGNHVPHHTDFTMRLNIAVKESNAVVHTKTEFPWTVIEFYDDNGDYVETI